MGDYKVKFNPFTGSLQWVANVAKLVKSINRKLLLMWATIAGTLAFGLGWGYLAVFGALTGNITLDSSTEGTVSTPASIEIIVNDVPGKNEAMRIGTCLIEFTDDSPTTDDYDCDDDYALIGTNGLTANQVADKIDLLNNITDINVGDLTASAGQANTTIFTAEENGFGEIYFKETAMIDKAMLQSIYDPNFIEKDAFDADNHSINIIDSPIYSSTQDAISLIFTSGIIDVDDFAIEDNGDGTVDISDGTVTIRSSDSPVGDLYVAPVSAISNLSLTNNSGNYIYVDYNSGNPIIDVTTDGASIRNNENDKFELYEVYRSGTSLHITKHFQKGANALRSLQIKSYELARVERANAEGGLILGETGTRNVTVTSGKIWVKLTTTLISAFDSSGSDRFSFFYSDGGGGFNEITGQSQWDNDRYNNSGTLTSLIVNRYSFQDVYLETDGDVDLIYAENQYVSLSAAENASRVNTPDILDDHAIYVGRIVFRKGDITAQSILSPFTGFMPQGTSVTNHNNLSNLGWSAAGHTGSVSSFAGFDSSGLATTYLENLYAKLTDLSWDTTSNVTSNSPGTLATDDFVFGSSQLNDDGNADHDERIIFDKSSGYFAAGEAQSTQWNTRGENGINLGYNNSVTGDYGAAIGAINSASGSSSTALGLASTASGFYGFAAGSNVTASDSSAVAFGRQFENNVARSFAVGYGVGPNDTNPDGLIRLEVDADEDGTKKTAIYLKPTIGAATNVTSKIENRSGTLYFEGNPILENPLTSNLNTAGYWLSGDGDNEGITINTSGNVGIGTSIPIWNFQTVGTSNGFMRFSDTAALGSNFIFARGRNTEASTNIVQDGDKIGTLAFMGYDGSSWSTNPYSATIVSVVNGTPGAGDVPGDLYFQTKPSGGSLTERMRIDSDGNVGIGTSTPGYELEVNGDIQADAYYYSSDRRLKENIKPLTASLAKISQLQGVAFDWKEDGGKGIGLIAQDVERVFPELVSTNENSGFKAVEYGNLVAPLIEALKEQQQEIEALEARIKNLETDDLQEGEIRIDSLCF